MTLAEVDLKSMPYTSIAHQPHWRIERPFHNRRGWGILSSIGYDDDKTYYLVVYLLNTNCGPELTFGVEPRNNATEISEPVIYCALAARKIVGEEPRDDLKLMLTTFVGRLLQAAHPGGFRMMTWDTDLPEKALIKYTVLCELFRTNGYAVSESRTEDGEWLWAMNWQPRSTLGS